MGNAHKNIDLGRLRRRMLFGALTLSVSVIASGQVFAVDDSALPAGGVVVGGTAAFDYNGSHLDVLQSSDRAVIDWQNFNIGQNASAEFHQPSSSSLAVNRVTGSGIDPTQILGSLKANGKIIVLDPNGVIFGQGAQINVGGILASTGSLDTAGVMAGGHAITLDHIDTGGAIVNNGTISVADAGLAAFVAPTVVNNGIITARLGQVVLAGGTQATFDLYGDGLVELSVDKDELSQLIANNGLIAAQGGQVLLQAAAAKKIVDNVVLNTGVITANGASVDDAGRIVLYSQGAHTKNDDSGKAGSSHTINTGFLDAGTQKAGAKGGNVDVLGDNVVLGAGSVIAASGDAGGGTIKIGGDYLGQGDTPTANNTYVDHQAFIFNNANTSGDGGRTTIWSDNTTEFHGFVLSRGGFESGNGGFLETSGKINLKADGSADLSNLVEGYHKGTYLLDPANITIYGNVDPKFVSTDSSINLGGALRFWADGADASSFTLNYNSDGLSGAHISGAIGTNTITTTANINLTSVLPVGAKIRLGNIDGQTALASDTSNTDTYTVISVSYTGGSSIITLGSNLTTNYNGGSGNNTVYRGLVSQWDDQSANNYDVSLTATSRMPIYVSTALNGKGGVYFDGGDNLLSPVGGYPTNANYTVSTVVKQTASNTGNVLSGNNAGHAFYFSGGQNICMYAGGCFATSNTALPYGTPGILDGTYANGTGQGNIYQNSQFVGGGTGGANNENRFNLGSYGNGNYYTGYIYDALLYNAVLPTAARNVLEQYQSAKWNIALDPLAGAGSETAEAMASTAKGDASDGFGVFTTRYLEKLSATADIVLAANNSITLDLKGDALTLANDRSLSLTTLNGDITDVSAGSIVTNRTGSGGNISMTAGGAGNILLDTTDLQTGGGGRLNLSANGAIDLLQASTLNLGTISAQTISLRNSGVGSDINLMTGGSITANGSGNSVVLQTSDDFTNNAGGGSINAGTGRYLIYANAPTDITKGGLAAKNLYNKTYITGAPGTISAGLNDRFVYAFQPTLTFTADDVALQTYDPATAHFTYTYTGLQSDDLEADAFTGMPDFTVTQAGANSYSVAISQGTLASPIGYAFAFTATPATLTVPAAGLGGNVQTYTGDYTPPFSNDFAGEATFKLAALNEADDQAFLGLNIDLLSGGVEAEAVSGAAASANCMVNFIQSDNAQTQCVLK